MQGEWGSIGYDDEGNPSERNVLIRDGILTGYMIDILGGRRMNMAPTGSGRRQNYRFAQMCIRDRLDGFRHGQSSSFLRQSIENIPVFCQAALFSYRM